MFAAHLARASSDVRRTETGRDALGPNCWDEVGSGNAILASLSIEMATAAGLSQRELWWSSQPRDGPPDGRLYGVMTPLPNPSRADTSHAAYAARQPFLVALAILNAPSDDLAN
jgi:hypothetical protein